MFRKRLICFFLFLSVFISNGIYSQESTSNFDFVNIKEGVSKKGIYSITQDHYGFIWICTYGSGLYKFDGTDYTSYKFKIEDTTSISSNLAFSSYLDKKNRLWIGTEDGLNIYHRDLDQFEKIHIGNSDQTNISVLSIKEDLNGNLLLGTKKFGLFKLDLQTLNSINLTSKNNGLLAVNAIQVQNKTVFLGTNKGLRIIDNKNEQITRPNGNIDRIDLDSPIQCLFTDFNNDLWVGTYDNGIYKCTLKDGNIFDSTRFPISNKRILSIIQIADTSLLVGTENDGLFHLSNDGSIIKTYLYNKTDKNSIRSNSIWSLFIDREERIWMGYYNSGVAVSDKLFDKFKDIESLTNNTNSLQMGSVTGIVKDKDKRLWISMDGGGIDVLETKKSKFSHINISNNKTYSELTSNYIQTVFIDSKDNVWAGSWDNGFYILKKGQQSFENFNMQNTNGKLASNAILTIDEDKDGVIWLGTFYKGVYSFNYETKEFKHYNSDQFESFGIASSDVRKILVDKDGTIWLGTTTAGLFKINKLDNEEILVTSFIEPMSRAYNNQKSVSHILSLYECSKGYLWIGTHGAGLCRYDKTNDEFKWYNKFIGLNDENIASILEDSEGHIWVSGHSGISKLNVNTNEVINYTTKDGILSNDFNFNAALKDKDGTLYFGNYKGIDYFNPKDLKINSVVPSLYLTGLKVFNKEVLPNTKNSPLQKVITETNNIEFTHKQSVFTIEYVGINYTRAEKNQYAYYLEGFEESWNYVGNSRSATYTNLDYGDYVFKLKAANNDGVWNEEPLTLKIKILPPWWKTNLAIISYFILFFISLFLLNRMTRNRINEKQSIRNERIQRDQEDKLNEKKIQFFTNISHEFRTPLTLIMNPLQDVLKDASLNLTSSVKERLTIVYKNTDRLHRLINELMDFSRLELDKVNIKVEKFNIEDFIKDVLVYFNEEAYTRNIHFTIDTDIPNLSIWADQNMLEKIIFNLLSNAFKFTPDGGAINIDILSTDELVILPLVSESDPCKAIEIRISDTGPGIENEQINKIFERFYQVETLNKTYYGGTGIGLEVVKSFVSLHRGKIEVRSRLGQGTTFKVFLPKGKKYFNENEILSSLEKSLKKKKFILNEGLENNKSIDEDKALLKAKTLLIVEDSSELRNYLRSELKNYYKILIASNGVEGLKITNEANPDIIITDVIMPKMNGFEFCDKIKSDVKTSHIPVLMLTAKTGMDDLIGAAQFGADAYMVKPFDIRLLKSRLIQLIKSRQSIFDKYFGDVIGKEDIGGASSIEIDKEFIQSVLKHIYDNISNTDLSVELLAEQVNLSRSRLYRKIKGLTGYTVTEFIRKVRLQKAKQILEKGNSNISEVCYKVGFTSPSYFTKCFKAHFEILPTEVKVKESQ